MIAYVDASCVVPLLKLEPKSAALAEYLDDWTEDGHLVVAGELLETELRRVATRFGIAMEQVTAVLEDITIVAHASIDFRAAGAIPAVIATAALDAILGSLDALHLATAMRIGVDALMTDDTVLAEASIQAGIPVLDTSIPRTLI